MRLCLGLDAESGASLQDLADAAAKAGFRWLDLWLPALDTYLASYPSVLLASLLEERRLYVGMVSGLSPLPVAEGPALQAGQEGLALAREPFLLYQARMLTLCVDLDALGGGTVLVPIEETRASIGSPFPSPLERALCALADLAAPFEARLAVTPTLGQDDGERSIGDIAVLVDRVKRPNLGLGLDLSEGQIPASIPAATVGKIWAVRLGATGWAEESGSQLRALCAQLAAAGFSGSWSVTLVPGRDAIETLRVWENP
jgi:sugar phosphate isomerase/epimerase